MIIGPHYTFDLPMSDDPGLSVVDDIEFNVPGSLVYGLVPRRHTTRRVRFNRLSMEERRQLHGISIEAPMHGGWLVQERLNGLPYELNGVNTDVHPMFWEETPEFRDTLERDGRAIINRLIQQGLVHPHVAELVTPYQARGVAWSESRPWVLNVWACGSGKTLGTLLGALTCTGPIVVICPAKARQVWWSQTQEYTTLKPYRLIPKSDVRKKDITLDQYLQETERPFIIVGAESLSDHKHKIRQLRPEVLILDEIHIHGSNKRWKAIQQEDGSVSFEKRKTSASENAESAVSRETRAVAIMEVSRTSSLRLRMGCTATPIDDGRLRRLWSPLDLLSPGGFSHSYGKYAARFCDARPGKWGGLDDKGASNVDELKQRCAFLMHEVSYSESHAALPSTRVQVIYLDRTDLNRADRWDDQATFTQALRVMQNDASNPLARERMVEARLAEACTRKRRYVVDEVLEGLRGGGKVVVFTARRNETEAWGHAIRRALSQGDAQLSKPTPVWVGHGGVSEADRVQMVEQYKLSDGPCVLIGTGQAFGTAVDGMQTTDLAIFAMLPWKPGDFVQWKGRFDRLGGRATLLKVIVATGTYDERVIEILVDKFGPIQQMLEADELQGLGTKLLGLEDRDSIVASIIDKLGD